MRDVTVFAVAAAAAAALGASACMFADGDRSHDFIRRLAWALARRDGRVRALLVCNYRPTRISG